MLRSGETEISLFFGGDFGRGPEEGDRLGRWIADAINAALQQPGTAAVLAGILERIKSGEESQAACVEYRHVAGEISAFGALFAEALSRRKSRPSKKP